MEIMEDEIQYVIMMKPGRKYRHYYEDDKRDIEIVKVAENRYRFSFCGAGRTICRENNATLGTLLKKWTVFIYKTHTAE